MLTMLDDAKMRYGLYSFFHLALLNDLGSFALWISVKSAHCSTAFPPSSVVVYPHVVLWLLTLPIRILLWALTVLTGGVLLSL